MALRKVRYRREAFAEVNMTNLIDIVMVLLIVFILVSDFVNTGLDIKIPEVKYVRSTGKEKIIIAVDTGGKITLNGAAVDESELSSQLASLKEQYPGEGVFIRGDELTPWGEILNVSSIAIQLGFEQVNYPAKLKSKARE